MIELVKPGLAVVARSRAASRCIDLLEWFGDRRPNLLRVLTYHRVDEPENRPHLYPGLISATPEEFACQMQFVATKYRVVGLEEVLDACRRNCPLPPRSVLITFDDAYLDFAENAWPILKRHRLPVTLFVPTAFPDRPERVFWWDRLHQALTSPEGPAVLETPLGRLPLGSAADRTRTYRRLTEYVKTRPHAEVHPLVEQICCKVAGTLRVPSAKLQAVCSPSSANGESVTLPASEDACPASAADAGSSGNDILGWDALRRLAAEGVTLCPHTRTHPLLNRVSLQEARDEALGAVRDLQREIGRVERVLAYPAGGCSDEVARMLEAEGFEIAFATCRGINDFAVADRMLLRRINVGRRTAPAALRAQLLPWLIHFNRWLA